MEQIVRLHGVPLSIVSDRDPIFTSRFWKTFQNAMGTRLKMSTSHHLQTDGQSERTIQTLEDMLRASVLEDGGLCSNHLHLIEFAYNNSYHASIGMAPYEALYGKESDYTIPKIIHKPCKITSFQQPKFSSNTTQSIYMQLNQRTNPFL
ncbi:hypothetical protein QL285_008306 [Trifolium repens]|nr:hypothetical protein QL285_008306 [Trifolium repens]